VSSTRRNTSEKSVESGRGQAVFSQRLWEGLIIIGLWETCGGSDGKLSPYLTSVPFRIPYYICSPRIHVGLVARKFVASGKSQVKRDI
jgi:hypothetical protein